MLVSSDRRALLADFGLSTALNAGPTGFTTGNDARYTLRFSSPELLLQDTAVQSLANDIWSWGCLVLEVRSQGLNRHSAEVSANTRQSQALTGKIPFSKIQLDTKLMLELVKGRIPYDAKDLEHDLPQLSHLLVKCWDQQPSQRPAAVDCLGAIQSVLHPSGPGNITQRISRQSPPEQLQAFTNDAVEEQQPLRQRIPSPPQVLSTQPSSSLQELSQASLPLQRGLHGRPMPFRDFFTTEFTTWLADQQVTLDPLRIDGKEVLLYRLFLMVGALGGYRAVLHFVLILCCCRVN